MKITELGKAAIDAEALLLKKKSIRVSKQVVLCLIGALFGLFTLISVHIVIAALCWSFLHTAFIGTSLIIFAFDIVCTGILFYLVTIQKITEAEIEAKIIRNHSLRELRNSLAITTVIAALSGPLGDYIRRFLWRFIKNMFHKKTS